MRSTVVLSLLLLLSACQNQHFGKTETALSAAAAAGAGLGAIIVMKRAIPVQGLAIGSAVGALSGGLIGSRLDSTDRQLDDRDREIADRDRRIKKMSASFRIKIEWC